MEGGIINKYKKVILWSSLILVLFLVFLPVIRDILESFNLTQSVIMFIIPFIGIVFYYLLVVYSVIMLVYILAKKISEEYKFGFLVPFLLILFPFIFEIIFMNPTQPPESLTYTISITILFFYTLYRIWKIK